MIWNRPSNLWLGALSALFNVVVLVLAAQQVVVAPELVGAVNLALATMIALIAGQPPVIKTGDSVFVKNSNGYTPDKRVTFSDDGGHHTTIPVTYQTTHTPPSSPKVNGGGPTEYKVE